MIGEAGVDVAAVAGSATATTGLLVLTGPSIREAAARRRAVRRVRAARRLPGR